MITDYGITNYQLKDGQLVIGNSVICNRFNDFPFFVFIDRH